MSEIIPQPSNINSVFFRSTLKNLFFIPKLFLTVLWAIVTLVLICIVQFLPDEVAWKIVSTLFFQSSQSLVAAWVVSLTQSPGQTQDILSPSSWGVCPCAFPDPSSGCRLTHGNVGTLLDMCSWNGCPKPQHLAGASGREVLVLCIADVGSKAFNCAINLFQWARPKSHLLWVKNSD